MNQDFYTELVKKETQTVLEAVKGLNFQDKTAEEVKEALEGTGIFFDVWESLNVDDEVHVEYGHLEFIVLKDEAGLWRIEDEFSIYKQECGYTDDEDEECSPYLGRFNVYTQTWTTFEDEEDSTEFDCV